MSEDAAEDVTERRWFVRVEWKPQDCWVGVFWKSLYDHWSLWPAGTPYTTRSSPDIGWVRTTFDVWVCLLPMVPIHFGWRRHIGRDAAPSVQQPPVDPEVRG